MKTLLALIGAGFLIFVAYGAGTMKYTCITPSTHPIPDGSGRWFYMCIGPEPRPSERASMADAWRQVVAPDAPTVDQLLRPEIPTALVSPARPVHPAR